MLAFLPVLGNDFVNWDDPGMVIYNDGYRGLGWRQVRWAFTTIRFSHYHPLTWLSYGVDHALWGGDPRGYHFTNLLLHGLSTSAVFLLARELLRLGRGAGAPGTDSGAAAAALVFALHPLRVEPVAWVTARRDLLSAAFFFLTVLAYLRAASVPRTGDARREPGGDPPSRRGWLAAAVVLYAAALLSKSIAMTLPSVLVVLDWYPLRRRGWRFWVEKLPFVALGVAAAATAFMAVRVEEDFTGLATYGPVERAAMAAYSLAFYVWKTVLPIGLAAVYEAPRPLNVLEPRFVLSAVAVLGVATAAVLLRRRSPALAAASACYALTLLPVSGLMHAGHQLAYDRYSYVPGVACAVLAGGAVAALVAAWRRGDLRAPVLIAVGCAIAVVLGGWVHLTRRQILTWQNSENLWRVALDVDPACAVCHNGLGLALVAAQRYDDAEAELRYAVALNPQHALAVANLSGVLRTRGALAAQAGQYDEAIRRFTEAERLLPLDPGVIARLESARASARP